ncbi:MAG: hypothetical protein E7298_06310 [Lachnospiraceae bacterium]|nr:hypothetical protein [Lachnospiraceae bacterium]
MDRAIDQLKKLLVKNPSIHVDEGDICLFQSNAKLGRQYAQTSVKTKPGLGIGVGVPITQHFGIGIMRRKIKTEVRQETKWDKKSCMFFMLSEKFVIKVGKDLYEIDNDDITGMKIHSDAFIIRTSSADFTLFLSKMDVVRLKRVMDLAEKAAKEGDSLEELGYIPSKGYTDSDSYNRKALDSSIATSDYAKTVFLWTLNKKPSPIKKRDAYPEYFFYELGIQNAKEYHENLIRDGFLEEAGIEHYLAALKVDQIKELLSVNGLDTKGKKDELINRIVSTYSAEQLSPIIQERVYVLSSYGSDFLKEHEDYIKLHQNKNWEISYTEYDNAKYQNPSLSFGDICWGIFNSRIIKNKGNISLDRNEYFNMYQLLVLENKDKRAMEMLLRIFYIDVNVNRLFAPAIVKSIGDREEYYDPEYIDKLYSRKLSHMSYSKDRFKEMVEDIINGTFDESKYTR